MNTDLVKKANAIVEEIESLGKYKKFLDKRDNSVHFDIREHYGSDSGKVNIDKRHNERLIKIVENIITELKTELENL